MLTCKFENGNEASLRHAVVDVILIKDQEILLTKRAKGLLGENKWALPGGYVDRDELLLAAARREVQEETGWTVDSLKLFQIVDEPIITDSDRQNISFFYTAQAVSQENDPDHEVAEARWFKFSELPPAEEFTFDHDKRIQDYLNSRE